MNTVAIFCALVLISSVSGRLAEPVLDSLDTEIAAIRESFAQEIDNMPVVLDTPPARGFPDNNASLAVFPTYINFVMFMAPDCSGLPFQIVTYGTDLCFAVYDTNINASSTQYVWDDINQKLHQYFYTASHCLGESTIFGSPPPMSTSYPSGKCNMGSMWSISRKYTVPVASSLEKR
jgi:hypothetical protein